MSEKKMNSYHLASMEEPKGEMLSTLMKEVAMEAKLKGEEATNKFFEQMNEKIRIQKNGWSKKYNVTFGNG